MFERFTDTARQILVLAKQEAQDLGHGRVGNEHLLLGLLREGDSGAAVALSEAGMTLEAARAAVAEVAPREDDSDVRGHMPFSRGAKKTLELALRAALSHGQSFVAAPHLLLSLVSWPEPFPEGVITKAITRLGTDVGALKAAAFAAVEELGRSEPSLRYQRGGRRSRARRMPRSSEFRAAVGEPMVVPRPAVGYAEPLTPDMSGLLERLAKVQDSLVEEAKARAAAEARLEQLDALREELDSARKELAELRRILGEG